MELAGKTVLLSGATGGLGRTIATALAGRGASLVLSSRKREALEELAQALPGDGHRTAVADLAEPEAAERLAAEAGAVDALVANAGLPGTGRLDDFSQQELGRVLRVNLEAPIRLTRELVPGMQERGSGHLVYVTSLAGKAISPRASLYSATKFGLRGFALGLREDLWKRGIGVSLVTPGFVREAGMFHDSGAKPPPGFGTTTPDKVADGGCDGDRAQPPRGRRRPRGPADADELRDATPRAGGEDRVPARQRHEDRRAGRQRPVETSASLNL